jgi:hypothetical protein
VQELGSHEHRKEMAIAQRDQQAETHWGGIRGVVARGACLNQIPTFDVLEQRPTNDETAIQCGEDCQSETVNQNEKRVHSGPPTLMALEQRALEHGASPPCTTRSRSSEMAMVLLLLHAELRVTAALCQEMQT